MIVSCSGTGEVTLICDGCVESLNLELGHLIGGCGGRLAFEKAVLQWI